MSDESTQEIHIFKCWKMSVSWKKNEDIQLKTQMIN